MACFIALPYTMQSYIHYTLLYHRLLCNNAYISAPNVSIISNMVTITPQATIKLQLRSSNFRKK